MSNLSNQQINSSFNGLLQVPGGITSSLQQVQDGNGNGTGLYISSSGINGNTISSFVVTNNGTAITNAVSRLISDGFGDILSVKDFGALGNGFNNDAPAIQTAITYAAANNRTIFFPDGSYKVNTGIVLPPYCGVQTAGNATIIGAAGITVFTLTSGNYADTPLSLPGIVGGSTGLKLKGANLAVIYVPTILGCSGDALVLEIDNTNASCADNTITFDAFSTCTSGAGIKFNYLATTTSGKLMQGNAFYGNFITNVKYGIHFYDVNNGSVSNLPWDDTYFQIIAIDTAVTGSIGIYGQPSLPPGRTTFDIRGFFGGFDTAAIKGGANNNIFNLAFPAPPTYAQMQFNGVGNRLFDTGTPQQGIRGVSTPIALNTASGTVSTFNGGSAISANRFYASLTIGTALSSVAITGTAGQFSCSSVSLVVGTPITITGTFGGTGSISGYVSGATYYVIATNGTTTFTLSNSYGGSAITTTAGTPTGLTYTAGLGPLQSKAFAFYHVLMQNYGPRVFAEPLWANTPMIIIGAFENSTAGAGVGLLSPDNFMGEIDVLAVGPVLAAAYNLFIGVHDAAS